jgi:hypothetical protein
MSAVGVALSVMLILVLNGFLSGVYKQATAYLDNSPGSVVVVQEGIENFFAASSVLPPGTVESDSDCLRRPGRKLLFDLGSDGVPQVLRRR